MGRFWDALAALVGDRPPSGSVVAQIIPTWQAARPIPTKINYAAYVREGYKGNPVIFSCIREIVGSASEPVWIMDSGDDTEEIKNSDLIKLLNRPNPEQDGVALLSAGLTHQHVWGDWYLHKVRSRGRRVVQLWNLRPDRVEIKRKPDGSIDFYAYYPPGNTEGVSSRIGNWIEVPPDDVIHMKWEEDPESDNYGLSPITILGRLGDLDGLALDYLRGFFLNQGIPAGMLKLQNRVQKEERERIKGMFKEEFSAAGLGGQSAAGGAGAWHGVMVLDASVEYEQIAAPTEKLKLQPLFDTTESRICSVFNVPPILVGVMVGLEHSTYANYKEARRSLWEETLAPIYRKMSTALTNGLIHEFGLPEGTRVLPDLSKVAAMQDDVYQVSAKIQGEWKAGLIKLNEARSILGYEPEKDKKKGDAYFSAPAPVLPPGFAPHPALPAAEPVDGKPPKQGNVRRLPAATYARRDETWQAFIRRAEPLELAMMRDVASVIADAAGDALTEIRRQKIASAHLVSAVPEPDVFEASLVKMAEKHLPAILQSGWEFGVMQMRGVVEGQHAEPSQSAIDVQFDLLNPKVADYIVERPWEYAIQVAATVTQDMRDQITTGVEAGETIDEIAARIEAYENVGSMVRGKMIARTEVISAMNRGAFESYRAAKVVPRKQWLTARDARVRGTKASDEYDHVAADGQTVALDDPFIVSEETLLYPGDFNGSPGNVINCRCTVIPIFNEAHERYWKEEDHPRAPKGNSDGGKFAPKYTETDDYELVGQIDVTSDDAEEFLRSRAATMYDDVYDDGGKGTSSADYRMRAVVKAGVVKEISKRLRGKFTEKEAEEYLTSSGGFVTGEDPYDQVAQQVVDRWARSSGDSDSRAIAMQIRAREVFGLDTHQPGSWDSSPYGVRDANEFANRHKTVIDAALNAIHDNTQHQLAAEGVDEILLYRGVGLPKESFKHDAGALVFDTVRMQPLSSFTAHLPTAATFAYENSSDSEYGVIMAVRVPRSQIFSTSVTGPGCLVESEYIVKGAKGGVRAAAAARNPLLDTGASRSSGSWFVKAAQNWQKIQQGKDAAS